MSWLVVKRSRIRRGASMVEYAVILGLIMLVALGAVQAFGGKARNVFMCTVLPAIGNPLDTTKDCSQQAWLTAHNLTFSSSWTDIVTQCKAVDPNNPPGCVGHGAQILLSVADMQGILGLQSIYYGEDSTSYNNTLFSACNNYAQNTNTSTPDWQICYISAAAVIQEIVQGSPNYWQPQ